MQKKGRPEEKERGVLLGKLNTKDVSMEMATARSIETCGLLVKYSRYQLHVRADKIYL